MTIEEMAFWRDIVGTIAFVVIIGLTLYFLFGRDR